MKKYPILAVLLGAVVLVSQKSGLAADALDTWLWRNPVPEPVLLFSVAYGDGRFLAVGYSGTILSSTNGVDWTREESGTRNHLTGIAYGNNMFVALGQGVILTSGDGVRWVTHDTDGLPRLYSLTFANGLFVASGTSIATSPDGVHWTPRNSGGFAIAYGNGRFVGVGG